VKKLRAILTVLAILALAPLGLADSQAKGNIDTAQGERWSADQIGFFDTIFTSYSTTGYEDETSNTYEYKGISATAVLKTNSIELEDENNDGRSDTAVLEAQCKGDMMYLYQPSTQQDSWDWDEFKDNNKCEIDGCNGFDQRHQVSGRLDEHEFTVKANEGSVPNTAVLCQERVEEEGVKVSTWAAYQYSPDETIPEPNEAPSIVIDPLTTQPVTGEPFTIETTVSDDQKQPSTVITADLPNNMYERKASELTITTDQATCFTAQAKTTDPYGLTDKDTQEICVEPRPNPAFAVEKPVIKGKESRITPKQRNASHEWSVNGDLISTETNASINPSKTGCRNITHTAKNDITQATKTKQICVESLGETSIVQAQTQLVIGENTTYKAISEQSKTPTWSVNGETVQTGNNEYKYQPKNTGCQNITVSYGDGRKTTKDTITACAYESEPNLLQQILLWLGINIT